MANEKEMLKNIENDAIGTFQKFREPAEQVSLDMDKCFESLSKIQKDLLTQTENLNTIKFNQRDNISFEDTKTPTQEPSAPAA